jgi:hypothetical protein
MFDIPPKHTYTIKYMYYYKVLPEDGATNAGTFRRVFVTIHVFYCIRTFCWYIERIITVRKKYEIDRFNLF